MGDLAEGAEGDAGEDEDEDCPLRPGEADGCVASEAWDDVHGDAGDEEAGPAEELRDTVRLEVGGPGEADGFAAGDAKQDDGGCGEAERECDDDGGLDERAVEVLLGPGGDGVATATSESWLRWCGLIRHVCAVWGRRASWATRRQQAAASGEIGHNRADVGACAGENDGSRSDARDGATGAEQWAGGF